MAMKKKAEEQAVKIEVPELRIGRASLRIYGDSLIIHNFTAKARQEMLDKMMGKARGPRPVRDPKADFEGAKYLDAKKRDCIKANAIKLSIVAAARYCRGLPMTLLYETLFVMTDNKEGLLPIKHARCIPREDVVRVGKFPNVSTDLRYRPEYQDWSVEFDLTYNMDKLNVSQIANLVKLAGFHVGLCEWRPGHKGDHGRFEVELLEKKLRRAA